MFKKASFKILIALFTPLTLSKNYLDQVLERNLDCDLDRNPEDVPIYYGHSLFNSTKRIKQSFSTLRRPNDATKPDGLQQ